jgi:hypothetical protein
VDRSRVAVFFNAAMNILAEKLAASSKALLHAVS